MITTLVDGGATLAGNTELSFTANSTLSANTTDGVFQFFVDTSDMVTGEVVVINVYEKVRSGGTQRKIYSSVLADAQSDHIWVSPSLILLHGWDVTANLTQGTGAFVEWSIRQVA